MNYFQELPMFKQMQFSEEELEIFDRYKKVINLNKGDRLLAEGETETAMRFLCKGLVRYHYRNNNRDINVQFSSEKEVVCCFHSYLAAEPSRYTIEAVEPSVLLSFERSDMELILVKGLKFILFARQITYQLYMQREQHERELLKYDALERLQHFVDTKRDLFLRLPQIYIASYLNIMPETLSALKKKLVY
jgi:CRP/FNR family transcriptional regulator, anaerobic regulatory protein